MDERLDVDVKLTGKGARLLFEPDALMDALAKDEKGFLEWCGFRLLDAARRKVKDAGKRGKPSKPGTPPKTHGGALRRALAFYVDAAGHRVYLGTRFSEVKDVMRVHERGGVETHAERAAPTYAPGDYGPIAADPGGRLRHFVSADGREKEIRTFHWFVRLTSPAMAERANALAARSWGGHRAYEAHYPARPLLAPALKASLPRIKYGLKAHAKKAIQGYVSGYGGAARHAER